jgi:hypothetical protein
MLTAIRGPDQVRRRMMEMSMDDVESPKRRRVTRGRPFARGESGNPADGRRAPAGRKTLAAAILLDGEAAALTRKAVERIGSRHHPSDLHSWYAPDACHPRRPSVVFPAKIGIHRAMGTGLRRCDNFFWV